MPCIRALLTGMTILFASPTSHAGEAATLTLGTATPGGGFAVYGQAVVDTIRETDPH